MLAALKRMVIFYFVLIVAGVIYFEVDGAQRLRLYLEQELSSRTGQTVKISSVGIDFWKPLSLELNDVAVQPAQKPAPFSFAIAKVIFRIPPSLAILEMAPEIRIQLVKPKFEMQLAAAVPKPTPPPTPGILPPEPEGFQGVPPMTITLPEKPSLAFRLGVTDGTIKLSQPASVDTKASSYDISGFGLNLQGTSLHTPINFDMKAKVVTEIDGTRSIMDSKLAIKITWDQQKNTLSLATIIAQIGAFRLNGDSQLNLGTGTTFFKAGLRADDLSQLPMMIPYLPFGNWSGTVDGSVSYNQVYGETPTIKFALDATKVRWAADWKDHDASLAGPVGVDLKINYESSPQLQHQGQFRFAVDSTAAELKYKDLFYKPKAVGLKLEAQGRIEKDYVQVDHSAVLFSSLLLKAQGKIAIDSTRPSTVSIQAGPSSLTGLEKFIPVLASAPLKGIIESSIFLEGPLSLPSSLVVKAKPVNLTGLNGKVQLDREGMKIKGPILGDVRMNIDAKGTELQNADVDGSLDLTALDILYLSKFEKPAGSPLKLRLLGKKVASEIVLNQSYVDVGGSRVVISGSVQNPAQPKLNINLQASKLELTQYAKMFPMLRTYGVSGTGQMQARVHGEFIPAKGFMQSPLNIEASLAATLPNFVIPVEPAAAATQTANSKLSTPAKLEPLLAQTPVTESLKLSYALDIGQLQHKDLVLRQVSVRGTLNRGIANFKPVVKSIWAGSAQSEFRLNVFESLPKIDLGVQLNNITAESAMAWISPEWKDLLAGALSGVIKGSIPHPKDPNFLNGAALEGTADLKRAVLNTLPLRTLLESKLSQIPGVAQNVKLPSSVQPGEVTSTFKLARGVLDISRFLNTQPDKSELDLKGTVGLDKMVNLAGEARMTNIGIGGSFRSANSDAQGRLVVPLQITGTAFKPDLNILDGTIKAMVAKTAEFEANKLKTQVTEKVKAEVDREIKTQGKAIVDKAEEEAQKLLKNIFK
jgi:hypothetical protein